MKPNPNIQDPGEPEDPPYPELTKGTYEFTPHDDEPLTRGFVEGGCVRQPFEGLPGRAEREPVTETPVIERLRYHADRLIRRNAHLNSSLSEEAAHLHATLLDATAKVAQLQAELDSFRPVAIEDAFGDYSHTILDWEIGKTSDDGWISWEGLYRKETTDDY